MKYQWHYRHSLHPNITSWRKLDQSENKRIPALPASLEIGSNENLFRIKKKHWLNIWINEWKFHSFKKKFPELPEDQNKPHYIHWLHAHKIYWLLYCTPSGEMNLEKMVFNQRKISVHLYGLNFKHFEHQFVLLRREGI